MANQGGDSVLRDYRKGNWTVQETMVLIEAKKMDDERRMKRIGEISTPATTSTSNTNELGRIINNNKPAELRWKWVEDYCWRHGCLRSQNQCNDKWDNLMRDFKKVRGYERKLGLERDGGGSSTSCSYWKIDKPERKERNLPSNMFPEIFEALVEVMEKKEGLRVVGSGGGPSNVVEIRSSNNVEVPQQQQRSILTPVLHCPVSASLAVLAAIAPPFPLLSPPPPPPPPATQPPHGLSHSHHPFPTVDMYESSHSDESEHSDSPTKRRRKEAREGTSGGSSSNIANEVLIGSAISKSASIIAEAIHACEEREEKRHRDVMSLQERMLQIEESKAEITRQGINGLVDSINKLATSILAFANNANNNHPHP